MFATHIAKIPTNIFPAKFNKNIVSVRTVSDVTRCAAHTAPSAAHCLLSSAAKATTPHAACDSTTAKHRNEDAKKKDWDSPPNPTVPGPRLSASTFTWLMRPDMMPKPRPITGSNQSVVPTSK